MELQGVPPNKCELLLVLVAVIHTFFWDTLYVMKDVDFHQSVI